MLKYLIGFIIFLAIRHFQMGLSGTFSENSMVYFSDDDVTMMVTLTMKIENPKE